MHQSRNNFWLEFDRVSTITKLRVIACRPDYIGPTDEEAHIGQTLLYWFFSPVGTAVMLS